MLKKPLQLLATASRVLGSRVRWKIVAPYIVLTLAVAVTGTYLATHFVTGSLEDRFANQLAEASRVASDSVVRRERQHLEVLRSISFTIGVPERTAAADAAGLQALIEPIAANASTEYVEILAADGSSVLSLRLEDLGQREYVPYSDGPDRAGLPLVRNVLDQTTDSRGDKYAAMVGLPEGSAFYTAGPIRDGEELVGVVLIGSSLEGFLPKIKQEALADVTVYDLSGAVLASTFVLGDGPEDSAANLRPAVAPSDSGGFVGFREAKSLYGRDFDLVYGELRIRDETVGFFSTALPSSFISSAGATTRWYMTVIFGLATVAVLLVGLTVANGVTEPLLRLVRTARAVTAGDLTARSGVESSDEVGSLASSFDTMTARLAKQHLATIAALTSAIDARDPYTAGHSIRVGQLAVEIGRRMELPSRDLQLLEIGGYLHDVGKIGIRDNVLLKPGPLTAAERVLIEDHPRIGLHIVGQVDLAREVLDFIASHHEKLDGTGYPLGLEGDRITVHARIAAVSDIYDALTTDRPYRPGLTVERAVEYLKDEGAGGHLDLRVVYSFIAVIPLWERRRRTEQALKGLSLAELSELAPEVA